MGTVLVTGGAGYIGSHVVLALQELGEQVVIVDIVSAEASPRLDAEYICGNVQSRDLLHSIFNTFNIDAVMHLAAYIDVEESVREPQKYYDNNTRTTEVLLEEADRVGIQYFIFSSTAAVYGTPNSCPVSEIAAVQPESPYGSSKAQAEEALLRHFINYWSAACVVLRYFNVAGADPAQRVGYRVTDSATHLIRRALLAALGLVPKLTVFGTDYPTHDGTAVRDYVHVSDIASAHVAALMACRSQNARPFSVYNVGYGQWYTVLEVLETVKRVTGKDFPVAFGPRRPGDSAALVADASRIKRVLRWEPQYDDLNMMVQHEYEWIKSRLR